MIVRVTKLGQLYAFPRDIAVLIGQKSPTRFLKRFRDFCESRPNYFEGQYPYLEMEGSDVTYNIYCFLHWFEHRDLLDAGSRCVSFKKDIKRIREMVALSTLVKEEVY